MKIFFKLSAVAIVLFTSQLTFAATPQQNLSERLDLVNSFSANFKQDVISPDGELVNSGTGKFWLQRPSFFRWHTVTPDENLLISDGKTLWYYNPFVEQVTAMWLDSATAETPFTLITKNDPQEWNKYNVTQTDDQFTLIAKNQATNLASFTIAVTDKGEVERFSIKEQDGQESNFTLSAFNAMKIAQDKFIFTPPEGVELDDQRN
ncbi:outer membrane lipoprotein chaperone LolA [Vibrio sp. SS-MA-C1-2]|uniref:outer membrane lipoprotein chaperone LolA n=1 Tax=Vibrio sp. SS-MA-C1-2 TaxID=2908646 RepID=UPI001F2D6133|nr:outer membrane lipoprotein chaperone LolA [Vibrio sp. SS-MA-C1-2]UJF19892.1 outer membrane lipoprotein chaperone LolA [Vibrio sp. SS-MA-C1-2]